MTRCPDQNDLQRFADAELRGRRRSRIAEHLQSCDPCARELRQFQKLGELVSSAIRKEAEGHDIAGLWERVSAGIASPSLPRRDWQSLFSLLWRPAAKVAYAALVVLLAGLFVVRPLLFPKGPRVTIRVAKVYSVDQYDPDVTVSMIIAPGGKSSVVWISGVEPTEEN